tara:strand:- start:1932 stop:2066 length:135 start_codon:yes stop_codon:yes gene_type:complete
MPLTTTSSTTYLVGEHKLAENRAGMERKLTASLIEGRDAEDICW